MTVITTSDEKNVSRNRFQPSLTWLRYGVFVVFVLMVVVFGLLRPEAFLQVSTLKSIFENAAVLAIVASGLTVVLAAGEFDLSFGAVAGLGGALAVFSMATLGQGAAVAVLFALVTGIFAGSVSGAVVSFGRVPALIGTLAVGSIALGLERMIMNDRTVYDGIDPNYISIAFGNWLTIPNATALSLIVVIGFSCLMSFTAFGRWIYAIGGNDDAARIAGIRTRRVRLIAFSLMGLCAGIAAVVLSSRASSYYPNAAGGLLLPAYAACFLGWSASPSGRFYPAFTYFGVLFMGVLGTGLIMMQVPSFVTDLVQGLVLVTAVLVARGIRREA